MANEALFATAGLVGLFVAMLTGALWDSPVASRLLILSDNLRSHGRHAMPQ